MVSTDEVVRAQLQVIVADDEAPAVAELSYLLGKDPRIGQIHTAHNAAQVLELLIRQTVHAIFLDIHMPGLNGIDFVRNLSGQEKTSSQENEGDAPGAQLPQPAIIFVTADEKRALEAFDVAAVDYLLKPVRRERLNEAVRRAAEHRSAEAPGAALRTTHADDELISVDQGGVSRIIRRSEVPYVQAHGDYARLHTRDNSYLVRIPLSELEERWRHYGFLRIHRSFLISLRHLGQMRWGRNSASVLINGVELPVSRRHLPSVRERLRATQISRHPDEQNNQSLPRHQKPVNQRSMCQDDG